MNILFTLTGHPERVEEGISMSTSRVAKELSKKNDMNVFFLNADNNASIFGHEETDTSNPCLTIKLPVNSGKANFLWRYALWLPKFLIVMTRLYFFCHKYNIHYIKTYLHERHLCFYWLSKISRIKYLCALHGSDVFYFHERSPTTQKRLLKLASGASAITAVSKALAVRGSEIFGGDLSITVIYNGVELPAIATEPLPFSLPEKFIVSIGRLHAVKGFDLGIMAFKDIHQKYPDLHYVIAGEGDERVHLTQLIQENQLEDHVHLVGQVASPHIPALLRKADICLAPSLSEGLSNVVLEAALVSTPILSTSVGGIPEIITSDDYGTLVPPGDAKLLSQSLLDMLEHPELQKQKAHKLQAFVEDKFSMNHVNDKYWALFTQM